MTYSSQQFESFLPVYDDIPSKWDEAKPFLVEQLKQIANIVNVREIGWLLDQELLTGQQFIPGNITGQFRSVLRMVVDCSPLVIGANTFAHNISIDSNFTLMHLYGAATNPTALTSIPLPNAVDTLSLDATNVLITSSAAYDRAWVVIEYIQEL